MTRQRLKRSRGGCITCKKRKVKCNEVHPRCAGCTRLKLICTYDKVLLWEDDANKRGITFGRSLKARERRQGRREETFPSSISLTEGLYCDTTTRRNNYLYINMTYKDLSEFYALNEDTGRNDNFLISRKDYKNPFHAKEYTIVDDFVGLQFDTLAMFEDKDSQKRKESKAEVSADEKTVDFDSKALPYMFSSANSPEDNGNFINNSRIDDVFLQSFLSTNSLLDSITSKLNSNTAVKDNSADLSDMTQTERSLLKYFEESICPFCICYPQSKYPTISNIISPSASEVDNPYLRVIAPQAYRSTIVMKVIVAASAKQLVLLGEEKYGGLSKKYTLDVLRELPKLIKEKQRSQSNDWDDILTTVLMLCFTEISVNCNGSWLMHLSGAKQFLKESCIRNNLSPVGLFFIRYFISHEIMGETAWVYDTVAESSKPIFDDPYIENLKHDSDTQIDLVLGCSPYLITLIHQISMLAKCFEDLEIESDGKREELEAVILLQTNEVELSLFGLKQVFVGTYDDSYASVYVDIIAEIKRLASLIYLTARIGLEYKYYHGPDDVYEKRFSKVPEYCKLIMELHNKLPDYYVSLLWPVFIVGIVATSEDERWFVLNSMTQMQKHRELRSVKIAKEVVLKVWKEKDLEERNHRWKDLFKGRANTISLA